MGTHQNSRTSKPVKKPGRNFIIATKSLAELKAKVVELDEELERYESKQTHNGGIGLLPGHFSLMTHKKGQLAKIHIRIKELENAGN